MNHFILISLFQLCYAAKILFISPSLSRSMLVQTGRMADLLVEAGHDVVRVFFILTPPPPP